MISEVVEHCNGILGCREHYDRVRLVLFLAMHKPYQAALR